MKKVLKIRRIIIKTISILFFVSASVISYVSLWIKSEFNIDFVTVISVLKGDTTGTGTQTKEMIISGCVFPLIVIIALYILAMWFYRKRKTGMVLKAKYHFLLLINLGGTILFLEIALIISNAAIQTSDYFHIKYSPSTFIEEEYVDPGNVHIQNDGRKRNLLLIYLESMENTYARCDASVNYMPQLTQLANENISFADGSCGGYHTCNGAGWTIASLFTSESGLPFKFKEEENSMGNRKTFAPNVYCLGDFLETEGYFQEFLCGSDVTFGGRNLFYSNHGNYTLYDYYSAKNDGYVDDFVWWGFDDETLFKIAKDQLTEISKQNTPFNYTMLTVDLHHVGGYVCNHCDNKYENQTANVVDCTDRLVNDFILWCKEQAWYDNTTIVILGDHPRMDSELVADFAYEERGIYNCFINAQNAENIETNKTISTVDLFPSILSAMGYSIEGNRLGLGVNAFSKEKNLSEKFGFERFNNYLAHESAFYTEKFDTQ